MTVLYAALGAAAGVLLVWMGPRFHIGSMFFDGVPGYIGSACAGAVVVLAIRYAVRKQYGLIIP